MRSAANQSTAIYLLKWLFILPLYAAGVAYAQLPGDPGGGGETFQVTVEYNCCGQVDIEYNNFFSNPGSQQITATAVGSTTIEAENLPFTIELTPSVGYVVEGLSVTQDDFGTCFISSENSSGSGVIYGLEAGAPCTFTASFAEESAPVNEYTVTPSAGTGGAISPNTPQRVQENQTAQFRLTPVIGYAIDPHVGGSCGGTLNGAIYTTNPLVADCDVIAAFTPTLYTVTPSAGPGGSISPSTEQAIEAGSRTQFTLTPDPGFVIVEPVSGSCGGTLTGTTYTTNSVVGDCDVEAVFTLAPAGWNQLGGYIDGERAGDGSGSSVALSSDGQTLAVGATGNGDNGRTAGHVRVYAWSGSAWSQLGGDIDGEAAGDLSGRSVALSSDGQTLAVGAYGNDGPSENSLDQRGHVRVYAWSGSDWTQLGSDIDGERAGDGSGSSVALSSDGQTLAVGATGNGDNGRTAGHVRVYAWNGSAWTQLGGDIDGEAAGDSSGVSVALSSDGHTLAVGANGNDGNGTDAGHVRVYAWSGSAWSQLGGDIDGEAAGDNSGYSVSLSSDGQTLAVGARLNAGNGPNAGHVRVYAWNSLAWTQLGGDIDGEPAGDSSGWSVALSSDGQTLAVGAPAFRDGDSTSAGYVRVYAFNDEDADGIVNNLDQCPDTPVLESVDVEGCSDSQKDDDNDGVSNTDDSCPITPIAELSDVDIAGCGPSERDTDDDGVTDDLDAFPNDPSETLDSDGDGFGDNEEISAGTDPNDPEDQPVSAGLPIWLLYEASKSD